MLRQNRKYSKLKTFEEKIAFIYKLIYDNADYPKIKGKRKIVNFEKALDYIERCCQGDRFLGFTLFYAKADMDEYRLTIELNNSINKNFIKFNEEDIKCKLTHKVLPFMKTDFKNKDMKLDIKDALEFLENLFEPVFMKDENKNNKLTDIFKYNLELYLNEYRNIKCSNLFEFNNIIKNRLKEINKEQKADLPKGLSLIECGDFIMTTLAKFYNDRQISYTNKDIIKLMDAALKGPIDICLFEEEYDEKYTIKWFLSLNQPKPRICYALLDKKTKEKFVLNLYKEFNFIKDLNEELNKLEFKKPIIKTKKVSNSTTLSNQNNKISFLSFIEAWRIIEAYYIVQKVFKSNMVVDAEEAKKLLDEVLNNNKLILLKNYEVMFNEKIVLANLILSYGNDAIINIEIIEDGKSTMYEMPRNSYIGNTINAIKSLKISDLIKFLGNQEINKK